MFFFLTAGNYVCALFSYEINNECSYPQITAPPHAYRANIEAQIGAIGGEWCCLKNNHHVIPQLHFGKKKPLC